MQIAIPNHLQVGDCDDPLLALLRAAAERNLVARDLTTYLMKSRQFDKALAQHVAVLWGIESSPEPTQAARLVILQHKRPLVRSVADMPLLVRQQGNAASHRFDATISEEQALYPLGVARELAVWLHPVFGKNATAFKPGPFAAPQPMDYAAPAPNLQAQGALKKAEGESTWLTTTAEKRRRKELEIEAATTTSDRSAWELPAQKEDQARLQLQAELEARLATPRASARAADADTAIATPVASAVQTIAIASQGIELDEPPTQVLIECQLWAAAWDADTLNLRHRKGARPNPAKPRHCRMTHRERSHRLHIVRRSHTPGGVLSQRNSALTCRRLSSKLNATAWATHPTTAHLVSGCMPHEEPRRNAGGLSHIGWACRSASSHTLCTFDSDIHDT